MNRDMVQLVNRRFIFASWNLRRCAISHARRRAAFLNTLNWDVLALQEVSQKAWEVLMEANIGMGFFALDMHDPSPSAQATHGVALIARNGLELHSAQRMEGLVKKERGIGATLLGLEQPVSVASWHSRNAAGEGVEIKMQGYQGFIDWINGTKGPVAVGFDGNHWNRRVDLKLAAVPKTPGAFHIENRFFSSDPQHRLRDVLIAYYSRDKYPYAQALKRRPNGPLAVSYVRGNQNPKEDRFDYIFVSPELEVDYAAYHWENARLTGSDHGLVLATLRLDGRLYR